MAVTAVGARGAAAGCFRGSSRVVEAVVGVVGVVVTAAARAAGCFRGSWCSRCSGSGRASTSPTTGTGARPRAAEGGETREAARVFCRVSDVRSGARAPETR